MQRKQIECELNGRSKVEMIHMNGNVPFTVGYQMKSHEDALRGNGEGNVFRRIGTHIEELQCNLKLFVSLTAAYAHTILSIPNSKFLILDLKASFDVEISTLRTLKALNTQNALELS